MNTPYPTTPPVDRRYQVFISSTFTTLEEQRKGAIEAVFELGHIPIALEGFSPANDSDHQVIEKAMQNSQIYILIVGARYGELVPGDELSYTEFEYQLAQKCGLITLVFKLHPDLIAQRRRQFEQSNDPRDRADIKNEERMTRFMERLKEHNACPFRPTEGGFKYVVKLALKDAIEHRNNPASQGDPSNFSPLRGFIREPDQTELLIDVANNPFIVQLVKELRDFKKLYDRTQKQRTKKERVAQFFIQQYENRLIRNKVSLFFESGSTIAYLAKELAASKPFTDAVKLTHKSEPSIQISTNNVLVYLLLWLNARIPCTTFPWSPPSENSYGAAYGGIERLPDRRPDYTQPGLDDDALRAIEDLLATPFTLKSMKAPTLLLGAVSGLQLNDNHRPILRDGLSNTRKAQLTDQVSRCLGPHVGSYHNRVFKRFMYATDLPVMIFLTSEKIDCPIPTDKCHFILDQHCTWDYFYTNHPLAFCVACEPDTITEHAGMFERLGFAITQENDGEEILSFIAKNQKFVERFDRQLTAVETTVTRPALVALQT
jgi:hypothetical protein